MPDVVIIIAVAAVAASITTILVSTMLRHPTVNQPSVVVNMPADAVPLAQLTKPTEISADDTISGKKAVLWWTVYKFTLDEYGFPSDAIDAADAAVQAAYDKDKDDEP